MKRVAILLTLVWLGCAGGPQPAPAPSTARPTAPTPAPAGSAQRVVLVTIDTLRADYVGCYGASDVQTPTLDRLATAGVRFENAISPVPITMPSHASLMTALDPPRHGVHANGKFRLPDRIPTLAEQFQRAGWATAGFVSAVVLDARYGLARGFDVYGDQMGFRRNIRGATGAYAERTADQVVDAVLEWLETAPDHFFLWVHFYDPHGNYAPPRGFRRKTRVTPPDPAKVGILEAAKVAFPPDYAGEIYFADTELGRLLRRLDARYPDSGTLVAVTSDHGESLGEHGELTHTLTTYDATQRVPLLLAGPGLPSGRVVDAPVRLVDVAPTLLELAGLPALDDTSGQSLLAWISGQRNDPLLAYVETLETQLAYGWSPVVGVRSDRYKYLRTVRPELYDLAADPHELHDIAAQNESTVRELDAALEQRIAGALPVEPNIVSAPQQTALLESLGYVVEGASENIPPLGWVGGEDPKDAIGGFITLLEARTELAQGRPKRARELLESQSATGGWVYQTRAEIALALGDADLAEQMARKMIAAQPVQAEGHLALGQALELRGALGPAADAYREAARINPTETDSIVALGRIAEKSGRIDDAIAQYRAALDSNAPNPDAALLLAAVYFDRGDSARAEALLSNVSGGSPQAVVRAALAQGRAGNPEAATARVQRAIEIGPTHPLLRAALESLKGG